MDKALLRCSDLVEALAETGAMITVSPNTSKKTTTFFIVFFPSFLFFFGLFLKLSSQHRIVGFSCEQLSKIRLVID